MGSRRVCAAAAVVGLCLAPAACGRIAFDPLAHDGDGTDTEPGGGADGGETPDASSDCAVTATPGLRAYLPFDEGTGATASDLSGHGNDGQLAGPGWDAGRVGGAVDLDGQNDEVNLGSAASVDDLTPLTMCAWVLPRSYPNEFPAIADKSSDTFTGGWNFYIESNETFGFLAQNRKWATGGSVELGVWQHLCASWDGSSGSGGIRLYKDGVAVATTDSGSNGNRTDSDAARDLVIGRVNDGNFAFDGLIDEFALYEGELDGAQIGAIFECASP